MEVEAALIRPVLRRLFWLAAADRGLLLEPLEPPGEDLLAPIEALGLDHRNLGAAELGAAYTALLGDSERKTTGSYYTPPELVERLLDSALEPVLDQTGDRPAALLAVTICDPACGAGHFLVAAARRVARRLPGPGALREVIRHCVYGVDMNPMAVELTKMALWLEAAEPGQPFGFLDARIRHGHSLIGALPQIPPPRRLPGRPRTPGAPPSSGRAGRRRPTGPRSPGWPPSTASSTGTWSSPRSSEPAASAASSATPRGNGSSTTGTRRARAGSCAPAAATRSPRAATSTPTPSSPRPGGR